ncbi:MAG TPA: ATP-binding protein [Candidatus Acidoferrum sp.]|nr:ATP-binding protein [Candidatus Acidoferrum sp.]
MFRLSALLRTLLIPLVLAVVAGIMAWLHHDWPLYSMFVVICYVLGIQMQRNEQLVKFNQEQDLAIKEAKRKHDEEKLRTALLSSVSHDLKTPLVTMLGAATSLRDLHQDLNRKDRADLLDSIISETQRLESYIQNLLDMTRLGHGKLSLSRVWVSVSEIYNVVSKRILRQFPHQDLRLEMPENLPPLHVHAALIEQGLFNGIENACKAGGPSSRIMVQAVVEPLSAGAHPNAAPMISIRICDQGPGLPADEWEPVFDQFYTFNQGDRYEKGTGLGLSICRSIFRVHGGDAKIIPPPPGYHHCLLLRLPALDSTKVLDKPAEYYV